MAKMVHGAEIRDREAGVATTSSQFCLSSCRLGPNSSAMRVQRGSSPASPDRALYVKLASWMNKHAPSVPSAKAFGTHAKQTIETHAAMCNEAKHIYQLANDECRYM